MLSHWPIRKKLRLGVGFLAASVLILFVSAVYGLYAYRGLVKSVSARATELPLANDLSEHVADLRVTLSQAKERVDYAELEDSVLDDSVTGLSDEDDEERATQDRELIMLREKYWSEFGLFRQTLARYRNALDHNRLRTATRLSDDRKERQVLAMIEEIVNRLDSEEISGSSVWLLQGGTRLGSLRDEVEELQQLTSQLPQFFHQRLTQLSGEVKSHYRVAITLAWVSFVISAGLLIGSFLFLREWIDKPIRQLVTGSREVAGGNFQYRIALDTHDEMSELADAMNAMTGRFCEIRDDLDRQVRQRTMEVLRSEKLASVGFLAAGVAHEINNPLASIALCSESLAGRIGDVLSPGQSADAEHELIVNYLDMIQRESFRCKQITEKLLDFSRMGDSEKHLTDVRELVGDVIEMVHHLGKYRDKEAILLPGEPVLAEINDSEMKQVVLNLVTNGLDSLDRGGRVEVAIERKAAQLEIVVSDDGNGMTDEVLQHLFEPFFTRQRSGQGTGLGLSITYRIVEEHGGTILPESDGPGTGSRFTIQLPLRQPESKGRLTGAA